MSSISAESLQAIARLSARELRLIEAKGGRGGDMVDDAGKVHALLDAVAVLDGADAAYALTGGVAVGLHSGVPRATLDTDLAVGTRHRGEDLVTSFVRAGFELRGEHAHSVNLRHGCGEPVQLAFDPAFDAMIERAESLDVDGVRVRVVTKHDLIAMKRRAARDPSQRRSRALGDAADVELLLGDVPHPDEGW